MAFLGLSVQGVVEELMINLYTNASDILKAYNHLPTLSHLNSRVRWCCHLLLFLFNFSIEGVLETDMKEVCGFVIWRKTLSDCTIVHKLSKPHLISSQSMFVSAAYSFHLQNIKYLYKTSRSLCVQ